MEGKWFEISNLATHPQLGIGIRRFGGIETENIRDTACREDLYSFILVRHERRRDEVPGNRSQRVNVDVFLLQLGEFLVEFLGE